MDEIRLKLTLANQTAVPTSSQRPGYIPTSWIKIMHWTGGTMFRADKRGEEVDSVYNSDG